MKDYVEFDINGKQYRISGADAFLPLADFLRYRAGLTGTKIVCAEGDCGACTVLSRSLRRGQSRFESLNSCIYFVWQIDGHQIITVEGLKKSGQLHPAQQAMIECHGAQCGYCTPGFVCSLAQLADDAKAEPFSIDRKRAQNYLTGNLCRCTGYEPILEAATQMSTVDLNRLTDFYPVDLATWQPTESVLVSHQNKMAFLPATIAEAQSFCHEKPQIIGGSTDLGVLCNKGKWAPQVQMSLKNIAELYEVQRKGWGYRIGANATLGSLSKTLKPDFAEFSRLLKIFAAPQIKNTATLVGNMMNASPIADLIPFLKVADVRVCLSGPDSQRMIGINEFFLPGYKQLDRKPDEFVTHLELPANGLDFKLYKVSRRKDLDISAVTAAFAYRLENGRFAHFAMSFGGVGPSVIRFGELEKRMVGQTPEPSSFLNLFEEIDRAVRPLSDVRGSADFRRLLVRNLLRKFCDEIRTKEAVA